MKRLLRMLWTPPRPPEADNAIGIAELTSHGTGRYVRWGSTFGWQRDVSPAKWIGPRLHPFAQDVGSIIPEGFEAYGRLFHPVERYDPSTGGTIRERWSEIAKRNQRVAHAEMQFHMISRPPGPPVEYGWRAQHDPQSGELPLEERRLLVEILRDHTTTPDRCWFCLWEGYGGFDDGGVDDRVRLPARDYVLYTGPVGHALDSPMQPISRDLSPNLWWPDDRTWFVATEIDFCWTYVGGSRELIDTLVRDARLEVLPREAHRQSDVGWRLGERGPRHAPGVTRSYQASPAIGHKSGGVASSRW